MVGTPPNASHHHRLDRLQGGQRIECLARVDDRDAAYHPGETAQYHAADVIQWQRIAEPAAAFNARACCEKQRIVEQAVMRERGRFRRSRGAGGELNVDRIVRLQQAGQLGETRRRSRTTKAAHAVERVKSRLRRIRHMHDRCQVRHAARPQCAGCASVEFRSQLPQHADIIAGLELVGADQRTALHLVQCVFQFRHAVARVKVDQDQAGLGGGILTQYPFDPVRRP